MEFAWFLGIDWATEAHQFCLLDAAGHVVLECTVAHNAEAIRARLQEVVARTGSLAARVAVAIETPRGALVDALLDLGFAVFALNPKQLDRFRDRFTAAGAKDDRRDAHVLGDALRTDPRAFRRVQLAAPRVVQLREALRTRDDVDQDVQRNARRLREQVYRIAPSLLTLCAGADEPWFWTVVEQATTPTARRALTRTQVATVLKAHRIRRWTADEVLAAVKVVEFPLAPGVIEATHAHIAVLLEQLRLLHAQQRRATHVIDRLLEDLAAPTAQEPGEHRDVTILLSLPGAGRKLAAAMRTEGAVPVAARDYAMLRAYSGIAPVTKASGKRAKRPLVLMRYACNHRLRNATYHWGRVAIQQDELCRAQYDGLRAKGHTHGRALRGVVDRLLRIAISMLNHRTVYDLAQLHVAHSLPAAVTVGA